MKKLLMLLLVMGLTTSLFAQITFSGDARVRPRLDVKDNGEYGGKTSDAYYLYRARLNVAAKVGSGWFFKTQLGTNGVAWWTGKFGDGSNLPSSSSVDGASRGALSFMQLYFGIARDNWGVHGGLIPLNSLKNPMLDLHYYPGKMLDIPFLIFSNMAAHGFASYFKVGPGKINATLLVDNNAGLYSEDVDGNEISSLKDQYTLMLDFAMKVAGMGIQPVVMYTQANEDEAAPITMGVNFSAPKLVGFTPSVNVGYSMEDAALVMNYTAWFFRAKIAGKLGPGGLTAWFDIAQKTDTATGLDDKTHDFKHLWVAYKFTLHKGDYGQVSVAPTWRTYMYSIDGEKDYTRHKIELTTEIKFK